MKIYSLSLRVCVLAAAASGLFAETLPIRHVKRPLAGAPLAEEAQGNRVESRAAAASSPTIPLWSASNGNYSFTMVGQSPLTPATNQLTSIVAPIIPLVFIFADGTILDPTNQDSTCLAGGAATTLTAASPIFQINGYAPGGTHIGYTQYPDAFQRSNFWQYTNPSGANPNYHLLLSANLQAEFLIRVPRASGSVLSSSGWCGGKIGLLELNWLDNYLKNTLFPQLGSMGVLPSNFPIFLTYNTVMYQGRTSNCCILGYHSGFYNPAFGNAIQTYTVSDFDSTGAFGDTRDVAVLSHEIGEWLDDPLGGNATPPWGHLGQVSGCQSELEVGDALSGTNIAMRMPNNFTYHLQELAFASWFFGQTSTGVNGWYSSNGTFRTPAALCQGR